MVHPTEASTITENIDSSLCFLCTFQIVCNFQVDRISLAGSSSVQLSSSSVSLESSELSSSSVFSDFSTSVVWGPLTSALLAGCSAFVASGPALFSLVGWLVSFSAELSAPFLGVLGSSWYFLHHGLFSSVGACPSFSRRSLSSLGLFWSFV